MKYRLLLIIILLGNCYTVLSQSNGFIPQDDRTRKAYEQVIRQTNTAKLLELARKAEVYFRDNQARAIAMAKEKGWQIRTVLPDSSVIELMGLDEKSHPIYYITQSNLNAGRTIRTDQVWTGGSMGLNLGGNGMIAGEWDAGRCRPTHNEFQTGAGTRVINGDGASNESHATHVGGTIIAKGNDSQARGMANEAFLKSFDWGSDEAEMATEGANGLLVSNHSYGQLAGWASGCRWYGDLNISPTLDYTFGLYTGSAAQWDQIAVDAPYYLICKAAGNDRGNNCASGDWEAFLGGTWVTNPPGYSRPPADGPYDCISTYGNAKNIMTVAAVNIQTNYTGPGSVSMSGFSSWGPTDDGRIKPDISAAGVGLYSTEVTNDNAYSTKSGTSMATPTVTGSALLIQEHHKNLTGSFMRSATLKGLIIHTADECGANPGPDYAYGWGLMNTGRAVQHITDNNLTSIIRENTLNQGETYTLQVYSDGSQPLRATICWTDPAGTPNAPVLNDRTPRLVNDLDLRITGGTTVMPWVLNPDSPASAATRGDNIRDNVEQVLIATPAPGYYTITVNHKGTLQGGQQKFSLIISTVTCFAEINPVTQTVYCTGETATLTSPSIPGVTYQWTRNGVDLVGETGTSLNATLSGTYRLRTTRGACIALSQPVELTFNPVTVAGTLASNQTVCAGTNVSLSLSGQTGNVLRWESSTDNFTTVTTINQTTPNLTVNAISTTTKFRAVVQSPACNILTSNEVQITVTGFAGTTSFDATVCADNHTGTITLTGNTGSVLYWESSTDNFTTVNVIPFTGNILTFTNLSVDTRFRAIIDNTPCPPAPSSATLISTIPQPNITVSASPSSPVCDLPGSVILTSVYMPAPPFDDCTRYTLQTVAFAPYPHAGTNVFGSAVDDAVSSAIALGFNFEFYCNTFNTFKVSSNGFLSFDNSFVNGCCNGGLIPSSDGINNLISAVWTDNLLSSADDVKYQVLGTAPNRIGVLSFGNTYKYYGGANIRAQVVLYETSNIIDIIAINIPASSYTRTMGIENGNGTIGLTPPGRNRSNTWSDANTTYRFIPFNSPANFSYTWSNISNGFTANTPIATDNSPVMGNSIYELTVAHAGTGCSKKYTIPYQIDAPTVAGTLSSDATVCQGANSGTLTLTGFTGNILRWESSTDNFATVNIIPNTTPTQSYTNLAQTTQYRAVVQSGVCSALTSNSVQISVDPATVAGTLSNDATVCASGNSGTLTLTGFTGNILRWESSTDNFATVNIIPNTTPTQSYTNLAQSTQYRAVVQSGVCSALTSNSVQISVDPATVAGTLSNDATVCQGANSGTLILTGFTGNILRWESSTDNFATVNIIPNTTPTQSYTNLAQTTQYRVVVQSGVCSALTSNSVQISVDPATVAGTLSSHATVCASGNSGTLTLTGFTGNIIRWESSTDSWTTVTTISNISPTLTFNNLIQTTEYRAVVQSGVCYLLATNHVRIQVDPITVAGMLSGDQTVCASGNSGSITLTGQTGSILRWESSTDNWATVSTITNTFVTQTFTNLTQTTAYRAVVQSGTCNQTVTNAVTITVDAPTVAGGLTAPVNNVCMPTHSSTIQLNGHQGNVLRWESSTDNWATVTTINNNTNVQPFSNLTQTTAYRAVIQSGVCAALTTAPLTITVYPATVAGTLSSDATVCAESNSGTLTLSGSVGSILRWESSTDNWATVTTIPNFINQYVYNNLTQNTAYRVVVQSGICNQLVTNTVQIRVDAQTVAGALLNNMTVCGDLNAGILTLNGFSGNILRWESTTDNWTTITTINNTTPNHAFNNLTQTTAYRAVVQSGVCSAKNSNPVTIQVDAPTVAGTLSSDATVCQSGNTGTLTLTGQTGNIVRWESSTDGFTSFSTINHTAPSYNFTNLTQTTAFRAVVKSGVCAVKVSNAVRVQVDLPTIAGTLSADQTVCSEQATGTLQVSGHQGNVIRWESSTDNWATVTTISNNSPTFVFNNLLQTTQFRAVIQSGICNPMVTNAVRIQVDPATIGGTLGMPLTVCGGNNSGTLTLTGYQGNIIRWESSETAFISGIVSISNTTANQIFVNLSRNTWYRAVVKSGICSEKFSAPVLISITQPPLGGTIGGSRTVCANSQSGTLTLRGHRGMVMRWESSTDNWATVNVLNGSGTSYTYSGLTQTTRFRVMVGGVVNCSPVYSTEAVVTVVPTTVAGTLTGDASVCAGNNTGTITLSGNLGQIIGWQRSTDNGLTWQNVSGGNPYRYANLTRTTWYRAVVRNNPCTAETTHFARITVFPVANAGTLTGNKTFCSDQNSGRISLYGNQGTLIRWEFSTDNWITINTLPPNGPFLNYINLAQTKQYRAVILSQQCGEVRTNVVTITVNPTLNGGTLTQDQTICTGQTATLTLTGHQGQILGWERSDDNWQTIFPIANTTSNHLVTNLPRTSAFRVKIGNGNCPSVYSNEVTITLRNAPIAGTISQNTTVCAGKNSGTLNLSGHEGNIVRWESSTDNWETVTTLTNNAPNHFYQNLTQTTQFRTVIANDPFCGTAITNPVTITVIPQSVAGILQGNDFACIGSPITLQVSGYTGQIVRWETSINSWQTVQTINNTADSYTFDNLTQTTAVRVIVQNGICPPETTNVKTIHLQEGLQGGVVSLVTGSGNNCANPVGYLQLSGYTGNILYWEYSNNNWTTIQTIAHTADTLNFNRLPMTAYYRAVLGGNGCNPVRSVAVQYISAFRVQVSAVTGCGALGYVTAHASGGLPPYRYILSPVSGGQPIPGTFTGLRAGNYILMALDSRNCIAQTSFTIQSITPAPLITAAGSNGPTNGRIVWTETPPGNPNVSYEVRFRPVGHPTWTTVTVTQGTELRVDTLQSGITYESQVRAQCHQFNSFTAWSLIQTFTTLSIKDGRLIVPNPLISIYPNPASDVLYLNGPYRTLRVYDSGGKMIWSSDQPQETINVKGWTSGIYYFRFITNAGDSLTHKVVIE